MPQQTVKSDTVIQRARSVIVARGNTIVLGLKVIGHDYTLARLTTRQTNYGGALAILALRQSTG